MPAKIEEILNRGGAAMKPRAFIGSSSEGLKYVQALIESLAGDFELTSWNTRGAFKPSNFTLESLLALTENFDYGIFVMTADDKAKIRETRQSITRDNIILEIGLFLGALGRSNCFLLVSDVKDLHLPTDLEGLTYIPFKETSARPRSRQVLQATKDPCDELRREFGKATGWNLSGKWKQTWSVENSSYFPRTNNSEAEVGVFGAEFQADRIRYSLTARINDKRIITGFWSGPDQNSYHGSCQLTISPDSRGITGKWVGFRSTGEVESGDWSWSKL